MNLRYVVIGVLALLTLGMLALVWPAYRRLVPNRGVRRDISEPVKLAETLKKMQTEAQANLKAATTVSKTFKDMQEPINLAAIKNPFEMPVVVSTPRANGRSAAAGRTAVDPIEVKIASLDLKGTVDAGRASLALINDEVYRIGDIVNGLTITAIYENGVQLADEEDDRRTLTLEGWQKTKGKVNR